MLSFITGWANISSNKSLFVLSSRSHRALINAVIAEAMQNGVPWEVDVVEFQFHSFWKRAKTT